MPSFLPFFDWEPMLKKILRKIDAIYGSKQCSKMPIIFKFGQTRCIFSFFLQCKNKYGIKFTIDDQSVDDVLGAKRKFL